MRSEECRDLRSALYIVESGKWKVESFGARKCAIKEIVKVTRSHIPLFCLQKGGVSVCERVRWTIQRTISSGRNKEYREVNNERDDYYERSE